MALIQTGMTAVASFFREVATIALPMTFYSVLLLDKRIRLDWACLIVEMIVTMSRRPCA